MYQNFLNRVRSVSHTHLMRLILTASGLAVATSALAMDVAGVKVDERTKLANQDLVLNGAGIRYAAAGFVRVYVAALYLPQKKNTSNDIGALKGAKHMKLMLLRDINANDFSKALLAGMRANLSNAEQQKHFDSLLKLGAIFGQIPSLKKGESITIDSIPGIGTMILVNNKRVGEVFPDDTFFQALLQIGNESRRSCTRGGIHMEDALQHEDPGVDAAGAVAAACILQYQQWGLHTGGAVA